VRVKAWPTLATQWGTQFLSNTIWTMRGKRLRNIGLEAECISRFSVRREIY